MTQQQGEAFQPITAVVHWWSNGVFFFLIASILLLGIGRLELPWALAGFSAWSISRTTFFFWLIGKVAFGFRYGPALGLKKIWFPLPLFTFLAVVTLSLLPDFHEAADYRYLFFAAMHCVMIIDIFAPPERQKLLVLLLGLLPAIFVIRGVFYNTSVLTFEQMNRFPYPFMHPNSAGLLLSMSIPLALGVVLSENRWLRNVALGSLGMQFGGLILTYSRGAWLACAASLFAVSVMARSLRRGALMLGLTGLVALLAIGPLRNRVTTLENPMADVAIVNRLRFMAEAFIVGLKNPLLGVGYGRDRLREGVKKETSNAQELGFIPHSHSMYTEMLAETGLLGLGTLLWMVLLNIVRLIKKTRSELSSSPRALCFSLSSSLIAFLVFGVADVPFYNHETRIFFFSVMALSYLALRDANVTSGKSNRWFSKLKSTLGQGELEAA